MPQARDEAGNIWEVDANGNPIRLIKAAVSTTDQAPVNPDYQVKSRTVDTQVSKAAADLRKTEQDIVTSQEQVKLDREKFVASQAAKGLQPDGRGGWIAIPGWKPPVPARPALQGKSYTDAIGAYQASVQLDNVINDIEDKFRKGPGSTAGPMGAQDYLPLPSMQQFDKASSAARGPVIAALNFSASQMNTPGEAQMNIGAYIPQSTDYDVTILDTIKRLRELQQRTLKQSVAVLGGIPDVNGNVRPVEQVNPAELPKGLVPPEEEKRLRSVWQTAHLLPASPGRAASPFATQQAFPVPDAMQQEHMAFLAKGNFTPEDYVAFRAALDQKYGYADPDEAKREEYRQGAERMLQVLQKGGDIGPIGPVTRDMSGIDRIRNSIVNNPVGAAVVGAGNMGSLGGVEALAGDQYNALRESRPVSTTLGEVVGAIAGTEGLGALGRSATRRVAPRLLGGGPLSRAARTLATDTAYGTGYGTIAQGDPVTGAAAGAIGSTLGQGGAKVLGDIVGGLATDPAARALVERGVPLTVPQRIGGMAKRIEDRAMSVPVLGDMIRNRRVDAMRGFNEGAFRDAGQSIGANISATGDAGLAGLYDEIGKAYDNATAGVTVPADTTLEADLRAAIKLAETLPPDLADRFRLALRNRVAPALDTGELTGEGYQQAMRGLKSYRAEVRKPGFEQDYRDALGAVMNSLEGQMVRGGGEDVVSGLGRANSAYRDYKILKDAIASAPAGTQAGEPGLFTPNQLLRAAGRSERKYPGTSTLKDYADIGQRVLPSSIPDSGTAGRVAQMMVPAALAGGGAGVNAATGESPAAGAVQGMTLGALVAALASRRGQKLLGQLLFNRPQAMQRTGKFLRDRQSVLGAAAIPLVIDANHPLVIDANQ